MKDYENDLKMYLANLKRGRWQSKNGHDDAVDFLAWVTEPVHTPNTPLYQRMYGRRWALPPHLWHGGWPLYPGVSRELMMSPLTPRRVVIYNAMARKAESPVKLPDAVDAGGASAPLISRPRYSVTIPLPSPLFFTCAGLVGAVFGAGVVLGQVI